MTAPSVSVTASPAPVLRFRHVDRPDLTVVIVTYGTGLVLERCLHDLHDALGEGDLAAEIIVVDNLHPERGTWAGDRVRLLTEGVRIVRATTNLGFAAANNLAVGIARAARLCLLNPDVFLRRGQLEELVAASEHAESAIVAPGLVWPDGTAQEFGCRVLADGDTRPILEPGEFQPDYASAACWVLPVTLFTTVGGFDEQYHPAYYEDVDFVFRARELGYELQVVDHVLVEHAHRSGSITVPDVSRQRARFVERWSSSLDTDQLD